MTGNAGCCQNYDGVFDDRMAKSIQKRYEKKGVRPSSKRLVKALQQYNWRGNSQLDIGGGIGAIFFELVPKGMATVCNVDISKAFLSVFQKMALERSLAENIDFRNADFLDVKDELETFDLVTLDKVICCYPDYVNLVEESVKRCNKVYAYVMPRDVWWVKMGQWFGQKLMNLFKINFTVYVHPTKGVSDILEQYGFVQKEIKYHWQWMTVVAEKKHEL